MAEKVKKCKRPCVYRAHEKALNGCDYLSMTGHSRGCPPGEKCTRFEQGERKKVIMDEWRTPAVYVDDDQKEILAYARVQRRRHLEYQIKNHR